MDGPWVDEPHAAEDVMPKKIAARAKFPTNIGFTRSSECLPIDWSSVFTKRRHTSKQVVARNHQMLSQRSFHAKVGPEDLAKAGRDLLVPKRASPPAGSW
jgi:hypothetical protein